MDISISLVRNKEELLAIQPLMRAYEKESLDEYYSGPGTIDEILIDEERNSEFWIAKTGETIVGFASGNKLGEQDGIYKQYGLDKIYVLNEHRGKKIGLQLHQARIDYARKLSFKEINAAVSAENIVMRKILEETGFTFKNMFGGYHAKLKLN